MRIGAPVRIAERHKPKLRCRIHNQVLRHPADMSHRQTGPHHELDDEITVAHSPQTVLGDGLEVELLTKELAVDNEWVACECAAA